MLTQEEIKKVVLESFIHKYPDISDLEYFSDLLFYLFKLDSDSYWGDFTKTEFNLKLIVEEHSAEIEIFKYIDPYDDNSYVGYTVSSIPIYMLEVKDELKSFIIKNSEECQKEIEKDNFESRVLNLISKVDKNKSFTLTYNHLENEFDIKELVSI